LGAGHLVSILKSVLLFTSFQQTHVKSRMSRELLCHVDYESYLYKLILFGHWTLK